MADTADLQGATESPGSAQLRAGWMLLAAALGACGGGASSSSVPSSGAGRARSNSAIASSSRVSASPGAASASAPSSGRSPARSPGDGPRCYPFVSKPEVVAELPSATTFTTDGSDLFWTDGHAIWKRPVAGGLGVVAKKIVNDAVPASQVKRLELDGEQLWLVAAYRPSGGCLGLVGFVGRDGGTVEKVGPAGCPVGFALTKERVVLQNESTSPGDGSIQGAVFSAPRARGAKTTVLKRGINGSSAVATDGTYAYFAGEIGAMHRILLVDGPTERVSDGRLGALDSIYGSSFAVDDRFLYLLHGHLNFNGLRLMRLPKAGGGDALELGDALPITPNGSGYPQGPLRLSERHVYWSHPAEGLVQRVAKDGTCGVETLAKGRAGADWLVVTASDLYWLEGEAAGPRRVMRLAL